MWPRLLEILYKPYPIMTQERNEIVGSINLYRIDQEKQADFIAEIGQKMLQKGAIQRSKEGKTDIFNLSLYIAYQREDKPISWNWVLDAFQQPSLETASSPKGIVVVKHNRDQLYAVTLGHSFFLVDKFCDRDFGFNFARKLKYDEIKTTTLTTPNSHRNKTVSTYVNYSELEFDSGESFAKLKAKVSVGKDFSLYKPSIEIGSSIKFATKDDSIDRVIDLILHIEHVLAVEEDKCQIPVFTKVSDASLLAQLNTRMEACINQNPTQINISELDIIGATEIFNHNDSDFLLKFGGKEKQISMLSSEEVKLFCQENNFDYASSILNISVVSLYNGVPVVTNQIRNLIDYTDDTEKCILVKGAWYRFNTDYLNYLQDSISEIDCEYHPEYDFSDTIHTAFINEQFQAIKDLSKNAGRTEQEIKQDLRKKYYAERTYNILRSSHDGFMNYDRIPTRADGATIEEMDLYKDGMMCAVKMGNTSAKLCYAIDQSLTALKLYRKGALPNIPEITTVVLWFVLERKEHIEDIEGTPNINKLNMLMLKNRLDQWKKEVRLQGLKPLIYINRNK